MKLLFSNFFACILYTFVLLKLYYIVSEPSWSKGSWICNYSFIGGGNRSFGENYRLIASPLQTLYWEHLSWEGFQLTTVMGIGTDCIVSCKSNYHSITTAPKLCNTVSIKQKYTIYMQRNWKIKASFLTTFYWICPPVQMFCYF
jgi:hypothetical protein